MPVLQHSVRSKVAPRGFVILTPILPGLADTPDYFNLTQ